MNNKLAAKINARNRVNTLVNLRSPDIFAAVAPFVGQSVNLRTGGLCVKLRKAIEALNLPNDFQGDLVTWESHRYSIRFTFRSVFTSVLGNSYAEEVVFVGDITDGVLEKLYNPPPVFRTYWTAEEIVAARAKVSKTRGELKDALLELGKFGEDDVN